MVFFLKTGRTFEKISKIAHSWIPITLFYQSNSFEMKVLSVENSFTGYAI
jgi:hypothetical protein